MRDDAQPTGEIVSDRRPNQPQQPTRSKRRAAERHDVSKSASMPFPLDARYISEAESKLQVRFPEAYRSWLSRSNGGELDAAGETWWLHPVRDDSDKKRLGRTWDDVVRQTEEARSGRGFPSTGVSIGDNGSGDRLVLLPADSDGQLSELACWCHETGCVEPIDGGVDAVFTPADPSGRLELVHFQSRTGRSRDKLIGLIYLWIAVAFFLAGVALIVFVFFPLCRERMV